MQQYFFPSKAETMAHLPTTPDPEALNMCAFLLEHFGLCTQRGHPESAINWCKDLYKMNPDAFLDVIAHGLVAVLNALEKIESE